MEVGMSFIRDFSDAFIGKPTRRIVRAVILVMLGVILGLLILAAFLWAVAQVHARDNGQWNDSPINIREWFQSVMQPDNPAVSCCGEADAFEADSFEIDGDHYVAIITDGKGVIPSGTRVQVPNNKMKWDRGNPTGHGIIFIGSSGQVYCYVAPGGV
jgi:cbb3-type cytochrome oxidase maturation protein